MENLYKHNAKTIHYYTFRFSIYNPEQNHQQESAGTDKKSADTGKKSADTGKKSVRTGTKSTGTGKILPPGTLTGNRIAVTGMIWTAYIRVNLSSNKTVTHWTPERHDHKLYNKYSGKHILVSTYYAQLNYIHTLTHLIITTHKRTGNTQIALQCQSGKCKIYQLSINTQLKNKNSFQFQLLQP